MKYELLLRGRAKADIRRAAKWYERQRKGLGRDFVAEVDAALGLIEANPEQYEVVHREIRHAVLRRFPYGVERPYSCAPQAVGAVYDRPGFFVQSL